MAVVRFQVQFTAASALPEDVITNTFHFEGPPSVDIENPLDMIEDFYTQTPSGASAIQEWFSSDSYGGDALITAYNMEDPKPRAPIATREFEVVPSSTNGYPQEVALVLSYQADPVSGISQARRRGRLYIGGLIPSAGNDSRPGAAIITSLVRNAQDLLLASNASINWKWVVYSPTRAASSSVADAFAEVTNGWVDNAWDTQRRRGLAPTTRNVWDDVTP